MRLVGPSGEQVGVVRVEDALRLAEEADLDLVEVAPDARPPVCKLMDYGKFKYESAMKARDARRNQANTQLKEIQFRPKIDEHDYATKRGHVERFLKGGDKVKCIVRFRGREQSRPELGIRLLQGLAEEMAELGAAKCPRVDVICPGFMADCLETLEEIDQLNRETFVEAGGGDFHYVPWANDSDGAVAALEEQSRIALAGWV